MTSPAWARWLLRLVVPVSCSDEVVGDVEELHRRRVARWGRGLAYAVTSADAIGLALSFGWARLGQAMSGGWLTGTEARLAFRQVVRTPVMSLTSVLALSVGIALAATGFTVVDAILRPELPFDGGDRLVEIRLRDAGDRSYRDYEAGVYGALSDAGVLEHVGAFRVARVNAAYGTGEIELLSALSLTPATVRYLPWRPVAGRRLSIADGRPGAPPVAVISEDLWERRFGRDPAVVGRTLSIAGEDRLVAGVLPGSVGYPYASDLWLPLSPRSLDDAAAPAGDIELIGVLAAGTDPSAAQARLTSVLSRWADERPALEPLVPDVRAVGHTRGALLPGLVFIAIFVGLLVVVAGNVANLVIARTAARHSELAVRTALGASRARLVAQLSAEVLLTGVLAAAAGLWASTAALAAFTAGEGDEIPIWLDFGLDVRRAAFAVGLMLLATLIAGVVPALRATRRDVAAALRGAGAGAGSRVFGRFDDAMIVAQIALSIGILGAAAMVHRGWIGAYGSRDPAMPAHEVVTAHLTVTSAPGSTLPDSVARLRSEVVSAARRLPGVVEVGTGTSLPWTDSPVGLVALELGSGSPDQATLRVPTAAVGAGFFELVDAPALAGRLFIESDHAVGARPVAIVNQPFVDRWLGGANAIGRRIRFVRPGDESPPLWREIVGVVPDRGLSAADPELAGGVYVPMGDEADFRLLLRVAGRPADVLPALQATIFAVDPAIAVTGTGVLSQQLRSLRRVYLIIGSTFTSLGGIVLLLSMMATFAILSFEVTRRTREIGVRVALGADRVAILRSVLGRVIVYMGAGGAIGTMLGLLLLAGARAMIVMRFPPTGPYVFPLLVLSATLAGLVAAWLPARRALSIRPMEALRSD